jgi:DNA-binding response OmpR family regulator
MKIFGKIVVIDDDISTLESIGSYLQEIGYEVYTATNGIVGLELIKQHKPDLVISDLMMPEMGGMELNKILKSINFNLPVIFISAYDWETGKKPYDYFAFMPKPIDIFELVKQVDLALVSDD